MPDTAPLPLAAPHAGPDAGPEPAFDRRPEQVPVRDAATVVLLRDGADGLEVWLQRRSPSLVFAGGMHAFPGGGIDPADAEAPVGGADLARQARVWQDNRLDRVRAWLAAAVRETTEEAGVDLDPASLVPWSRWITPVGSPRRFDARFYVAPCPRGLAPAPLTGEVAEADWWVVRQAVDRHATGDLPMWPPTISTLVQLASYDQTAAVLAAAPDRIDAVIE